ncbi:hypothetical protein [Alteromonas oceanisediminis]|uniref:hypothetical protein n=1 Tax=Alteromonas oceanisediminis TaxID=2836180 RepID=UPI001BD95F6E|nr:hypothetical protein [Alteromonas oceanisediminis]MBT0588076.1 hypothetical protein [Alteromonas oceanisediminis]
MSQPFSCSISHNVMRIRFLSNWDHRRDYAAMYNATGHIAKTAFRQQQWALWVDWNNWLIQIPEEERICLRTIQRHIAAGLSHIVHVTQHNPVTEWQLNNVASQHNTIEAKLVEKDGQAIKWLCSKGYDPECIAVDIKPEWLLATDGFNNELTSLGLDPKLFSADHNK